MAVADLREGAGSIVALDLKRIMSVIIAGVEGTCGVTRRLSMTWLLTVLPLRPDCLTPHPGLFASLLRGIDDRDEVCSLYCRPSKESVVLNLTVSLPPSLRLHPCRSKSCPTFSRPVLRPAPAWPEAS